MRRLLAIPLLASLAITAQAKKTEPVPDWATEYLKLATPADAAHSSAVLLMDEQLDTVDDAGRATERERTVIRILAPNGRADAADMCSQSYEADEKLLYIHAWTVTADGRTIQATDSDFSDEGEGGPAILQIDAHVRLLHPPAAEPGAVIVCESEEQLRPYMAEKTWHFQHSFPAIDQELEIDLPANLTQSSAWHNHVAAEPTQLPPNRWRWTLRNTPALDLRNLRATPRYAALAQRMSVRWSTSSPSGIKAQWQSLGAWWQQLEANRTDASPAITAKAQALTNGATSFYDKLSAITTYVQQNVRYFIVERGIGGFQAHPADKIFTSNYGDCKDKATITISMLSAVGIHAVYVPVDDRRGVVDPNVPSILGNHMITAIEIPADVKDDRLAAISTTTDGHRYLIFDPTDERTPVGDLRSDLQGSYGLLVTGTNSEVVRFPVLTPDANQGMEQGSFILAADGSLTGTASEQVSGSGSGEMRMWLKYTDTKERHDAIEQQLAESIPGVSLTGYHLTDTDKLTDPVTMHYELTAPNYARTAATLLLVRPSVLDAGLTQLEDKPRTLPIDLPATGHWRAHFTIALPSGYTVDELPDPVTLDTDFATYHSAVAVKDGQLSYERDFTIKKIELPATRAEDYKTFASAILHAQQSVAVLKQP